MRQYPVGLIDCYAAKIPSFERKGGEMVGLFLTECLSEIHNAGRRKAQCQSYFNNLPIIAIVPIGRKTARCSFQSHRKYL